MTEEVGEPESSSHLSGFRDKKEDLTVLCSEIYSKLSSLQVVSKGSRGHWAFK